VHLQVFWQRLLLPEGHIHYEHYVHMLEMAQLEGVTFLACKTSADLFDLTQEDFMEGVEIMLAGDFVKRAAGSDLHLVL